MQTTDEVVVLRNPRVMGELLVDFHSGQDTVFFSTLKKTSNMAIMQDRCCAIVNTKESGYGSPVSVAVHNVKRQGAFLFLCDDNQNVRVYRVVQTQALAVLASCHRRAGARQSLFRRESTIFEPHVFGLILRMAGALFDLYSTEKLFSAKIR